MIRVKLARPFSWRGNNSSPTLYSLAVNDDYRGAFHGEQAPTCPYGFPPGSYLFEGFALSNLTDSVRANELSAARSMHVRL